MTAEYYGNKHTDYASGIKIVDNLLQVAKGLIEAIKK